jgi:type III restriction enzyme
MAFEFKFNPDQAHQRAAIDAIIEVFHGFQRPKENGLSFDEVVANMAADDWLDEAWLQENLSFIQGKHNQAHPEAGVNVKPTLETDDGFLLEGVSNDSHKAPHFTIEMETGTGKTYVYFRTMLELFLRYGWRKFIIVVPSVAILEGVKKAFLTMQKHFAGLYGATNFRLLEYDGAKLGALRGFAQSQFPICLVMTQQSFNTANRNFYKATEKLQGEKKPFEWVQATRPIVILDEPQNMGSEKSKESIRTLKPLFVLRYSATHRAGQEPNLVYRLTPLAAFRGGLVKQIDVIGISELTLTSANLVRLEEVERGKPISAKVRTLALKSGQMSEQVFTLKNGDDLSKKSKLSEHAGLVVEEIIVGKDGNPDSLKFKNGLVVSSSDEVVGSRLEVWRAQIAQTIETHFEKQAALRDKGIKVLSLFFIDKVANYQGEPGTIRRLFDETFERMKTRDAFYSRLEAAQVRAAYFAKKKQKTGDDLYTDDLSSKDGEEAREAFQLIMRDKERLLSFTEPTAFIFAHSALKEGWDNPNVFQICTLNQTSSSMKKRQEIGRGLRLCVDQSGNRPEGEGINILTVVANESYESYVKNLQQNYVDDGEASPPPPRRPKDGTVTRREHLFSSAGFKQFWEKLKTRLEYQVTVDTEALIRECEVRFKNPALARFPSATLSVSKGRFIVTDYTLRVVKKYEDGVHIRIEYHDTRPDAAKVGLGIMAFENLDFILQEGDDLFKKFKADRNSSTKARREHFRGFKVIKIYQPNKRDVWHVEFGNGVVISEIQAERFQQTNLEATTQDSSRVLTTNLPIPDFIGQAALETHLTRATLTRIYAGLEIRQKAMLLENPVGWTNVFIAVVRDCLADHIADRISYQLGTLKPFVLDEIFPVNEKKAQVELVDGGSKSLYDKVQVDSEVEERFVKGSLMDDQGNIVVYFKFPPKFKIGLPRLIGDYNPDWGILRLHPNGAGEIELVRETKGNENLAKLRFSSEARKIRAAEKYFAVLGVGYRTVTDATARYFDPKPLEQDAML